MKRNAVSLKSVLGVSLLLFFLIGTVSADVGIGIRWFTESEFVNEGEQKCISYGIYNPFDTDVNGFLMATKELGGIYESEASKLIPAGTSSGEALPTQICFNAPKVYEEESFSGFLTQRTCSEEEVILSGDVEAAYELGGGAGTGSRTGASFAAPLRLRLKCNPVARNWTPVYVLIILIVAGIGLAYRKKRRSR